MIATLVWTAMVAAAGSNYAPMLVPLAVGGAAGGAFVLWHAIIGKQWTWLAILVVLLTILSMSFRSREVGDAGLDPQNGAKMLAWFGLLAIGLTRLSRIKRLFADPVVLAFACYCVVNIFSALYSPVMAFSLITALGVASYLAFACVLASDVSPRLVVQTMVWSLVAFCIVNLLSVVVVPDMAFLNSDPHDILRADLGAEAGDVRFQGLSGHPNALAREAAMLVVLTVMAAYRGYLRPLMYIPIGLLAVFTALVTQSRSSLAAVAAAAVFQLPRRLLLFIIGTIVLAGALVVLSGETTMLLGLVGRDGDVDDAMSMAGRTDLWSFVLDLISQRPLVGYGFNSFEAFASTLWIGQSTASVATHEAYLSVLYSAGLMGAAPFFAGLLLLLLRWAREPDLARDLLVFDIIINSFSEIEIASISILPTLIFFIVIAMDAQKRLQ